MTADDWCVIRNKLVGEMQNSLKDVRYVLGLSGKDLGDILGLSRQSISKLETHTSTLTVAQYIAVRHLIDEYRDIYPENLVLRMLCGRLDCNIDRPWTDVIFLCSRKSPISYSVKS